MTSRGAVGLLTVVLATAAACGPGAPPPPAFPPGLLLTGDGPALARLLSSLARFEGTPVASAVGSVGVDPATCGLVEARTTDAAELLGALRCVDSMAAPAAAALGGEQLLLALPRGDAHVVVTARVDEGGRTTLSTRLDPSELPPLLGGLTDDPSEAVLSGEATLLHARFKTTGIAETVAAATGDADGQGERLFALSSSILAGTVLDGTVEAAWYAPGEGDGVPPLAAALGVSSRAAAAEGTARYVDALAERWPIVGSAVKVGDAAGQCLDGLRVMPGFAPCWAATDRALVLAWNQETLRHALGGPAGAVPTGEGRVHLDRFAAADDTLRRARGLATGPEVAIDYPWRRLTVVASRDDALVLHAVLEPMAAE